VRSAPPSPSVAPYLLAFLSSPFSRLNFQSAHLTARPPRTDVVATIRLIGAAIFAGRTRASGHDALLSRAAHEASPSVQTLRYGLPLTPRIGPFRVILVQAHGISVRVLQFLALVGA
jgi:hypothetical protein